MVGSLLSPIVTGMSKITLFAIGITLYKFILICEGGLCPSGWTAFRSSCYLHVSKQETFSSAKAGCEARGAYLATIQDEQENDLVTQVCRAQNPYHRYCWIGLTRPSPAPDGTVSERRRGWQWLDGQTYVWTQWEGEKQAQPEEMDSIALLSAYNGFWYGSLRSPAIPHRAACEMTQISKRCPIGWTVFKMNCYLISTNDKYNYTDAAAECEKLGAHLATIGNNIENEMVQGLCRQTRGERSPYCFIGLTRAGPAPDVPVSEPGPDDVKRYQEESRQGWKWVNGESYTWMNWQDGREAEPGAGESAARIVPKTGDWSGGLYTATPHYVCEMETDIYYYGGAERDNSNEYTASYDYPIFPAAPFSSTATTTTDETTKDATDVSQIVIMVLAAFLILCFGLIGGYIARTKCKNQCGSFASQNKHDLRREPSGIYYEIDDSNMETSPETNEASIVANINANGDADDDYKYAYANGDEYVIPVPYGTSESGIQPKPIDSDGYLTPIPYGTSKSGIQSKPTDADGYLVMGTPGPCGTNDLTEAKPIPSEGGDDYQYPVVPDAEDKHQYTALDATKTNTNQ